MTAFANPVQRIVSTVAPMNSLARSCGQGAARLVARKPRATEVARPAIEGQ